MAQFPINLVSVSLTTIAADTGTGTAGLQWVQSIYILAMSAAVLSAGVIAENIGRRRVMVIALWMMAAGTALGGGALGLAILGSVWATVLAGGGSLSEALSAAIAATTGLLVLAAACLLAEFVGRGQDARSTQ